MSLLVSLLIDAGVVKEGEPQNSAGYGRPSTPLMLGRRQGVRRRHAGQRRRLWMHGFGHQPRHTQARMGGCRHERRQADVVFGKLDAMAKAMAEV
ncbi:MAG: hypothetical protein R2683_01325 [Bifidobacterium adolescentis]